MLDPSTIACLVSSCIAFAVFIARRTVLAFRAMAAMSSTTLAVCGWWAWLLRDGMGPDSIETHGAEALAVMRTLKRALESGHVHHAYRFEGPAGVGKMMTAQRFARALVCEQGGLGCESCSACRRHATITTG